MQGNTPGRYVVTEVGGSTTTPTLVRQRRRPVRAHGEPKVEDWEGPFWIFSLAGSTCQVTTNFYNDIEVKAS